MVPEQIAQPCLQRHRYQLSAFSIDTDPILADRAWLNDAAPVCRHHNSSTCWRLHLTTRFVDQTQTHLQHNPPILGLPRACPAPSRQDRGLDVIALTGG